MLSPPQQLAPPLSLSQFFKEHREDSEIGRPTEKLVRGKKHHTQKKESLENGY